MEILVTWFFFFFRHVSREEKSQAEEEAEFDAGPKLDLGFKEGQTIRINIGVSIGWESHLEA